MTSLPDPLPETEIADLIAAAADAATRAYAPYSHYHVGAALRFADGLVVTGCNFENISYGLSICAETAAVISANLQGRRTGLVAVAISGGKRVDAEIRLEAAPLTPCGRCRQVLNEVARLGDTDPMVYSARAGGYAQHRLSVLLPESFGPASLR